MEEFGMSIKLGDPFFTFTYINEIKGSHSIEVVYFAEFEDKIDNIQIDPEDHSGYEWIADDEIEKLISDKKPEDNIEIVAIKKGFALLRGESLQF